MELLTPTHLIFVLIVGLLVLGPKRLPEVGKSLGSGLREFKESISSHDDDEDHHPKVARSQAREDEASDEAPATPRTTA